MSRIFSIKENKGTALFMTLMILTSILTVALGAANVVMSGILMNRTQTFSTKAIYAAEAGAEKALYEVRKNNLYLDSDQLNIFGTTTLSNNSTFTVDYATSSPYIIITSNGLYSGARRSVQLSF